MFNTQMDSLDRIIKAKIDLNRDRPFFAYILLNMNVEQTQPTEQVPSMGINQFGDLYWNEKFIESLSDEELQAVLAHEVMHIATLTFQREGNRNKMLWNMATDIAINYLLTEEGFSLPKDCLLTKHGKFTLKDKNGKNPSINVIDKGAEDIYDWLMQHIEIVKNGYGDGQSESNGNYQGGFDSHLPGDQDAEGKSQGKGKSDADMKANEEAWKQKAIDAATSAKARGSMSGSMERLFDGLLEPKIDWRKRLNQYITREIPVDYTMRRPGRRYYGTGCYFPSVVRENLEVITAMDVSGSITDDEYAIFASECIGIATSFAQIKMRSLWWSTTIYDQDDIEVNQATATQVLTHKPKSTGGTTMSCIKPYVMKKGYNSRIYVILTDGYIESKPDLPDGRILFVISKGGSDKIVKDYGEVCSLNDVERCMSE